MAIPSEYAYLLETVDFLWRNTQIYAIASGKSMRYYSSSYNICYQPANECSFLSYNEQSSSFQESKMIATTVGSIHITDNGGIVTVSYDNFKLNFWSEYNQKWIEWIEPDGTYGDYLEVPHTGSWKTSQTVDFRNFQTSFNSLSDACNYIYYNFKHCYIYYNNELWVNPNPPEAITSNGGGATHIAKVTGQLKDLSSNLSDILMVSGGGGGGLLLGDSGWHGTEQNIAWSGNNNKLTVQLDDDDVLFKMYIGSSNIYSFTAPVSDISNIYLQFLIDSENEVAKPSFVYKNGSSYSFNQEEPTDSEMADIYTWLSAGLPSE